MSYANNTTKITVAMAMKFIKEAKAEAWEQGFHAGFDHGADDIGGWQQVLDYDEAGPEFDNPYKD